MSDISGINQPSANIHEVSILGSTGSIGRQVLEVIAAHPGRFRVAALSAWENTELLLEQWNSFRPSYIGIGKADLASVLRANLPAEVTVFAGEEGLCELASLAQADTVLAAIAGMAGLKPTLAAIQAAKRVAIANKEPLVSAGEIVMAEAARTGATILPVDSEHSAIFQLLEGRPKESVRKVILTGSGGPFREQPEDLSCVTPEQALAHPTWKMGKKVTIDSATLMNKGLELIEAHRLFDLPIDDIAVVIHPQSIVHSMIECVDGAVLAHLAAPDMRIPIQYALGYPERLAASWAGFDILATRELTFLQPDVERFPCLRLARDAARTGGTAPAVMNAADEVAVEGFLVGKILFTDIPRIVERALAAHSPIMQPTLEDILAADETTRQSIELP